MLHAGYLGEEADRFGASQMGEPGRAGITEVLCLLSQLQNIFPCRPIFEATQSMKSG